MNNIIDGNLFFKHSSIKNLENSQLVEAYSRLRTGGVYFTKRYKLTEYDLVHVAEVMRDRTFER